MGTHLRLFYKFLFLWLLCGTGLYAQINYSDDFEGSLDWDGDFYDDFFACNGDMSWTGNFYIYDGDDEPTTAETVSPSIGTSNGLPVTLTYNYSLLDWDFEEAMPNSPSWGSFTLEYGASATGPWTLIETVSPSNHTVSDNCAQRTVTFTPPAGQVYLRFFGTPGPVPGVDEYIDVLLNIDDVVAVQELPGCTGAPAVSATSASSVLACFNENITLSLTPAYTLEYNYQWQSSADGVEYTDVAAGGNSETYITTQEADTWYRAVVSCEAGVDEVISTPVLVESTGANCYCALEFGFDVEPITLVNFAGINNTTSNTVNGTPDVEDFTSLAPGVVVKGQSYQITLKGNTGGSWTNYFKVYIDFNNNGNLNDAGESFEIGTIANTDGTNATQVQGNIMIPYTAVSGMVRMRVFKVFGGYPEDPCGEDYGFGQAEDYLLDVSCATVAPTADAEQSFCPADAVVENLEATGTDILWYAEETGGEPLSGDTMLEDGETYYAAQVDGCESDDRAEVMVTLIVVAVDEMDDVMSCGAYTLPVLVNGTYYTETAAGGEMLEAGDVIEADATVYIYAEADACSAETSFNVIVIEVVDLGGSATQTFVEGATVADLVVESQDGAIVTWYASEEDAMAGENALEATEVLEDGMYYAIQQLENCSSNVFAVTVDVTLGVEDFDLSKLVYHPNPVGNELNISYSSNITAVEVYNFLGQQVIAKTINQTDAKVDMSLLAAGTYMVKVNTETGFTTLKVIKN